MDKAIAIFEKSLEESAAQVKAEMASAKAVEAEEIVKTVKRKRKRQAPQGGGSHAGRERGR